MPQLTLQLDNDPADFPLSSKVGPAIAFGSALALLAAASGDLLLSLRGVGRSAELVTGTYQVINRAGDLLSSLKDAETGQRGYLLARDERYLAPYRAGRGRVTNTLAQLRLLVADDPAQERRISRLEPLVRAKLTELERTVELARVGRREAAVSILRTGAGQVLMERIRSEIAAFGRAEQRTLAERRSALDQGERTGITHALVLGGAALLATVVGVMFLLLRNRRIARNLAAASAALDTRGAQLRATYETAPVGLSLQDRNLRYLLVNARMAEINGRSVEAHLGRTLHEAIPEVAPAVEPVLARIFETGEPILDLDVRTAAGPDAAEARDYLASYWPVKDDHGAVIGVAAAVLDVTDRRAAERTLRDFASRLEREVGARTAELSAANQQLEAFAYTVSHDLRAPLRGMEGFARILLEDFAEPLGREGQRYADRIVNAAERMERLIDDLLTFSRLQRVEVALRALDPTSIVGAAIDDVRADAPDASVEMLGDLPPVIAEPVVLGQVVANLLTNAVKFRKPGTPANVRVSGERRDGRVRLWVEDEGIGIGPEHQDRIFGAFERLHGQEAYPGTGIGLAIVKAGMERLRGTAGVESVEGRGSRFWIELDAPGDCEDGRVRSPAGKQSRHA